MFFLFRTSELGFIISISIYTNLSNLINETYIAYHCLRGSALNTVSQIGMYNT